MSREVDQVVETVPIECLHELYQGLPFPYLAYRQAMAEEATTLTQFFSVGSSTAEVRPEEEWNSLGREIHDAAQVERHARMVAKILSGLAMTEFVVQQAVPESLWFRGDRRAISGAADRMLTYLEEHNAATDVSSWRGAFLVRKEIGDFLTYFLDYPFLLRYYDLEILSTQMPVMMVVNHHLSIEYVSSDCGLIDKLRRLIASEKILEFPNREAGSDFGR